MDICFSPKEMYMSQHASFFLQERAPSFSFFLALAARSCTNWAKDVEVSAQRCTRLTTSRQRHLPTPQQRERVSALSSWHPGHENWWVGVETKRVLCGGDCGPDGNNTTTGCTVHTESKPRQKVTRPQRTTKEPTLDQRGGG